MIPTVETTSLDFVQGELANSHIYEEHVLTKFSIIFRDDSVMTCTAEDIARAVRATENANLQNEKLAARVLSQVRRLWARLQTWCQAHSSEISTACLVLSGIRGKLWFAVMKKDRCYSTDFASSLSQLEIDIEDAECFDTITVCVMDFPQMSKEQFERAIAGVW
jgi:hypothetical protein